MLRRLSVLIAWPLLAFERRRVLEQLAEMDDRGLADIGLTRQDLRDVSALPRGADATAALAQRAAEREGLAKAARRRRDAAPAFRAAAE